MYVKEKNRKVRQRSIWLWFIIFSFQFTILLAFGLPGAVVLEGWIFATFSIFKFFKIFQFFQKFQIIKTVLHLWQGYLLDYTSTCWRKRQLASELVVLGAHKVIQMTQVSSAPLFPSPHASRWEINFRRRIGGQDLQLTINKPIFPTYPQLSVFLVLIARGF